MAISKAVAAGRLDRTAEGIDLKNAKTVAYLTTAKRQRRQGKPAPGGEISPKPAQRQARSTPKRKPKASKRAAVPEGGGPLEIDGETYGMAELRKMHEQANKEELQNHVRRGELVERTDVHLFMSRLFKIHTSQLKTLSDRLGPDIAAAFKLTDADTPRVQEIASSDVRSILKQIKKEMNEYLDSIGDGEVDQPELGT